MHSCYRRKVSSVCLLLATFGANEGSLQKCDAVRVCMKTHDGGSYNLEVFVEHAT